MKRLSNLIGACLSAVSLAACGGTGLSSSTPTSVTPSLGSQPALGRYATHRVGKNVQTETVLYRFAGQPDGAYPGTGALTNVTGTLYGTTQQGGFNNYGAVLASTTSGSESILYSFAGPPSDGAGPVSGVTNVNGTLYGTTLRGGANNYGTVYSLTTSGSETVLWNFGGSGDGQNPIGGLINVGVTLYGTTINGGASNEGTIFKIRCRLANCTESVLHSFAGGSDGANPVGSLTNVNGTLYGTTEGGGASSDGTVFTITASGAYNQLYSFAGGSDGAVPLGGLTKVAGTLYGTTGNGGGTGCTGNGCGTLFKITASGTETVLYTFKGGSDGAHPRYGTLIKLGGIFYGTTGNGGASNKGTIFALLGPSGPEIVLYSFAGGSDGAYPNAGLINVGGTLYGLTGYGGTSSGFGTIFSLSF